MQIRGRERAVLVAGAAGSGKSTLGASLARRAGAALLDLDTLTNPVLEGLQSAGVFGGRHWNDPSLRAVVRPARYAALRDAIAAQPARAVAVAPWTAELAGGAPWRDLVDALGAEPHVVWLRAGVELLAQRRAGRGFDRDAHVVEPGAEPVIAHIEVDAALPTAEQVERVEAALRG